MHGETVKFIQ